LRFGSLLSPFEDELDGAGEGAEAGGGARVRLLATLDEAEMTLLLKASVDFSK
jgi:hypothetical protein